MTGWGAEGFAGCSRPAGLVHHPPVSPQCCLSLSSADLAADEQLLHLMALRYGDASRRIGFSDFVCCMLRLETMTSEFRCRGLGSGRGCGSRELGKTEGSGRMQGMCC